jgi:hypothetical protein
MAELLVDAIVAQAYYSLLLRFEPLTEKYANALIDQVLRGTQGLLPRHCCRSRFSPPCAGNAPPDSERRGPRTVQPRVCGERPLFHANPLAHGGSAPRVRGTPALSR